MEGKKYYIAIGCEGEYGYVYNVIVDIPWEAPYVTSEELPWITVETPDFEEYPEFVITAFKDEYISAEQEISVLKGKLSVTTDRGTVKEKESFSVIVWDQYNNKVEGCICYLDVDGSEGDSCSTGSNGIAYLIAPEVTDNAVINIKAFKGGYLSGSTTIRVESVSEGMFMDGLTPIITALIVLIFAMLFVRVKKEFLRTKYKPKVDLPKQKEKTDEYNKENLAGKVNPKKIHLNKKIDEKLPVMEKGPWVEEIRIHRPEKKKETKYVMEEAKKDGPRLKKGECEWFKGKDYMRYKIDELTGEIDGQTEGKWFEGVDNIKSKVDRKLKNSFRNKDKKK
ncbi:MAG: hypothetical protein JSW60_06305 [Thermoplasmatales archaeon]|nr:MAG: hypothetical protein JSW60_06305 [Thermoplasmatales archaeon]